LLFLLINYLKITYLRKHFL